MKNTQAKNLSLSLRSCGTPSHLLGSDSQDAHLFVARPRWEICTNLDSYWKRESHLKLRTTRPQAALPKCTLRKPSAIAGAFMKPAAASLRFISHRSPPRLQLIGAFFWNPLPIQDKNSSAFEGSSTPMPSLQSFWNLTLCDVTVKISREYDSIEGRRASLKRSRLCMHMFGKTIQVAQAELLGPPQGVSNESTRF
jgi:hypothetical protein